MRKKFLNKNQNEESINVAIKEANDAMILSMDSHMESWILDFKASFHSTSQECMLNNTAKNFGKVYQTNDEPLDIVEKCDDHIKMPN